MSKSYINFKIIGKKPKTNVYGVYNANSDILLGIIKWFASWRQYCFFPNGERVFSKGCMNEISEYINNLMEERKKE